MKRTLIATAVLCLAPTLAGANGAVYRAVLDGRIHALVSINADAGETAGRVAYEKGAEPLWLEAKKLPEGAFSWREKEWSRTTGDLKPAGIFTGKLGPDGKTGAGTWTAADGKKKLPFRLTRIAVLKSLADKDVNANVEFPKLDDTRYAKLNEKLAATAQKELMEHGLAVRAMREEFKGTGSAAVDALASSTDCGIESLAENTVSLLCILEEYSGGAHGMATPEGRNFVVAADGEPSPLGLWDLLQKSPANAKKLSGLILAELKRLKASLVEDGSIKNFVKELEGDEIPFTLVPSGLAFHFAPYAVGSYAEGMFRAVIPNRELAEFLREDGPLAARAEKP